MNANSVQAFFENKDFQNVFFGLCERWMDEHEYENIESYAQPIKNILSKICANQDWVNNIKMTKRPFGFKVKLPYTYKDGKTINSTLIVSVSSNGKYSWTVKNK